MSTENAGLVAGWRYPGKWSVYDLPSATLVLDEIDDYRAVSDSADGALVGFLCIGAAARVPGLAEDPRFVDVGMGLAPALTGQGHGAEFGQAILEFIEREYPDRWPRTVVQSWNQRSLRLTHRLGFLEVDALVCTQNGQPVHYRVLVRRG